MRSFSCWCATRVRARPLSPLVDAPALHTPHPVPRLNSGHSLLLSRQALFPSRPLHHWGRRAPPLPPVCGAEGREQPWVPPSEPRAPLPSVSFRGVRSSGSVVGAETLLGFQPHLRYCPPESPDRPFGVSVLSGSPEVLSSLGPFGPKIPCLRRNLAYGLSVVFCFVFFLFFFKNVTCII